MGRRHSFHQDGCDPDGKDSLSLFRHAGVLVGLGFRVISDSVANFIREWALLAVALPSLWIAGVTFGSKQHVTFAIQAMKASSIAQEGWILIPDMLLLVLSA